MDAKISVTTKCNASCQTCPVWQYQGETMSLHNFEKLWAWLEDEPRVSRILLNSTGDMFVIPNARRYFDVIRERTKEVILTTNAELMEFVPDVDELVISFNGGTPEAYERTTGLDFVTVRDQILSHYREIERLPHAEIHCLIWEGNEGTEGDLRKLWADFPGQVRISYKYDNQMQEDRTIEAYKGRGRVFCDYLQILSIWPNGQVISCAHDFAGVTHWGNVFHDSGDDIFQHPDRVAKIEEHHKGVWSGLCEKCNYNRPTNGMTRYLR